MAESFLADVGFDEEVQQLIRMSDAVTSGDEARAQSGSDDGDDDVRDHIVAHDDRQDLAREGSVVEMTTARRSTQVVPLQPMTSDHQYLSCLLLLGHQHTLDCRTWTV
jgi:hypothetical protein